MSTTTEKLLTEVNGIIEKHKKIDEITGKNFNIFKVCEIDEKEVLICRFIYQLINQKGLHNQGDVFLKKFITDVLGVVISEDELRTLVVEKEKAISVQDFIDGSVREHRIDLLITTSKRVIPIEVKIFASDQEHQCGNYLKWASEQPQGDYSLYYLTLDGQVPSSYSVAYTMDLDKYESDYAISKELNDRYRIKCISFKSEIVTWIEDCIKDINIIYKKQIVDNLMQFLNIVRELCNMNDNELNNDLKTILENTQNFESYREMKNCENEIKKKVLLEIVEGIRKKLVDVMVFDEDYNGYKKNISDFCEHKITYPGVGIVCEKKYNDLELCVAFEVDKQEPYCGIYVKDKNRRELSINKEINDKLGDGGNYNQTWGYWKWFKMNFLNCPNFYDPNSEFAALIDEDKREKFIGAVVDEMMRLCKLINEKL